MMLIYLIGCFDIFRYVLAIHDSFLDWIFFTAESAESAEEEKRKMYIYDANLFNIIPFLKSIKQLSFFHVSCNLYFAPLSRTGKMPVPQTMSSVVWWDSSPPANIFYL